MGGAERVVDVDVGELGEAAGERGVVRLLARVEPQVLEQDDVAGLGDGRLDVGAITSSSAVTGALEELAEALGRPGRAGARRRPALRPAEVRRDHEARAALEELTRSSGRVARIRRSSAIAPSRSGTLRSARTEHARAGEVAEVVEGRGCVTG